MSNRAPQAHQLAPMFPELLRSDDAVTTARVAFYEEIVAEGPIAIEEAAEFWTLDAPAHLIGEQRLLYLAGRIAEIEFPSVVPTVAVAA